jgi:hypothetical protein
LFKKIIYKKNKKSVKTIIVFLQLKNYLLKTKSNLKKLRENFLLYISKLNLNVNYFVLSYHYDNYDFIKLKHYFYQKPQIIIDLSSDPLANSPFSNFINEQTESE